jgi:hypothetical protein
MAAKTLTKEQISTLRDKALAEVGVCVCVCVCVRYRKLNFLNFPLDERDLVGKAVDAYYLAGVGDDVLQVATHTHTHA